MKDVRIEIFEVAKEEYKKFLEEGLYLKKIIY